MNFRKIFSVIIILITIFNFSACVNNDNELKIIETILVDSSSYFYTNLDSYKTKNPSLPIGIFDSGTGGLTVFDAIVNFDKFNNADHSYSDNGDSLRDFDSEVFIYLADQANMPYGNYSGLNKTFLLKEHIIKDVQFLLDKKYYQTPDDENYQVDKSPIKALVIACNTATAFGKTDIENFIAKANLDIKVIGVIGAGVKAALENISLDENVSIAVMATAGTVSSNGYVDEINYQLKQRNNIGEVNVFQQAGIGLAGAIDEAIEFIDPSATSPRNNYKGPSDVNESLKIDKNILAAYNFDWSGNKMLFDGSIENPTNIQINSIENYISYHLTSLVEQINKSKNSNKLSSIILGCTHYPFFTDVFIKKIDWLRDYKVDGKFIYKNFIADEISFIDPAIFTAKELYDYLAKENIFNNSSIDKSEFYISVPSLTNKNAVVDEFGDFTYDYKYGRNENEIQEYVKRIPFSKNNISGNVAERLFDKIPYTYSLIKNFSLRNSKTSYLKDEERLK